MAKKRQTKKAIKQAKKLAKKSPKLFITLVVLLAIAAIIFIVPVKNAVEKYPSCGRSISGNAIEPMSPPI